MRVFLERPSNYRNRGYRPPINHEEIKFIYKGSADITCSTFGCPKTLSLIEQLCGSRCTSCMTSVKSVDVNKVLKYP